MPAWTTACPDWERRLIERRSIIPAPIYPDQAEQALAIFKALRVVDLPKSIWDDALGGYRSPTFGECSEQWVFDYVAAIFGAYNAETGQQLIREFYLLISKKNTKSTIAAGIMLTAVILCWREQEEHLILAPTKEVADNSFKPAAGMVRADPELLALFHPQDHIRTITHRVTGASLKVVAADTDTVSGKKSGRVLIDEHWLFGTKSNAESMFMEATGGQISREEGWVIYLTTQSDEPPAGVFKEKLEYFRDVRDGKILDPKSLGVLYEFPRAMIESGAYLDPANFYITNPNIGRSVSAEWLEDQIKKLRHKTDGAFQKLIAKHLNVQIGMNLRADRWIGADYWPRCATPGLSLDDVIAQSDVLEVGIDFGGADDWFALCVLGRHATTGDWLHWGKAWAHGDAFERRKSEAARWRDFIAEGDLVEVQEVGDEIGEAVSIVMQCEATGLLDRVAVDSYKVQSLDDALTDAGFDRERLIAIPQGWKLVGAIYAVERKLAAKKFKHGGRPIMAYAIGNAKAVPRGNNIVIEKQTAGASKIDPVLALFHAASALSLAPAQNVIGSDYELTTA